MARNCMDILRTQWQQKKFLCVGLDSDKEFLPPVRWQGQMAREWQLIFNKEIVDATAEFAAAFKLNPAFYLSDGLTGLWVLERTIDYILYAHPEVPVILDGKFGDVDNSTKHYAEFAFDRLGADAVTVNPYLGREGALEPFLERKDKGIFVVCRTTNRGSKIFQNPVPGPYNSLYGSVAISVCNFWNVYGNCGLVVGATDPEALRYIRGIAPDIPILAPGVGAQGGEITEVVRNGLDSSGLGLLISASRSVIYASPRSDFARAAAREAKRLHDEINRASPVASDLSRSGIGARAEKTRSKRRR